MMLNTGNLRGAAKLSVVKGLLEKLSLDLRSHNLSSHERDAALEELKVYGRDPRDADPIFTKEGLATLSAHAFDGSSAVTSQKAMRCLANAIHLQPGCRQLLLDLGYAPKVCAKLASDSWDDEFLASRLLWLATYTKSTIFETLITEHGLADHIVERLKSHSMVTFDKEKSGATEDAMEGMALSETLKLLLNLAHFFPSFRDRFTPAVPFLVNMICKRPLPVTKVLDHPIGHLVNCLPDLELSNAEVRPAFFPPNEPDCFVQRMIQIVERALIEYDDNDLETTLTPAVLVLCSTQEFSPEPVQQMMQHKLLPTEEDRKEVLGKSNNLSARLLKTITNALTPNLRKAVSHLLFALSDKDAAKFIEKVGFGYASGFLFENNIPVPESVLGGSSSAGTTAPGVAPAGKAVNPITGQFLDAENLGEIPEMSQQEKEREAERLFVLFERLKRTGIMDVQNPVEKAFQEGRFEELSDEEDVDGDDQGVSPQKKDGK